MYTHKRKILNKSPKTLFLFINFIYFVYVIQTHFIGVLQNFSCLNMSHITKLFICDSIKVTTTLTQEFIRFQLKFCAEVKYNLRQCTCKRQVHVKLRYVYEVFVCTYLNNCTFYWLKSNKGKGFIWESS